MNRILLVDDDEHFLEGCRRGLRRRFDVTTASSPEAALALLDQNGGFAVVVSDLRMGPGMDGIGFLARVRERAPDTVRMMLTGFADLTSAMDAVNTGHVFRFLTKPCPPETLAQALQDGLRQYELTRARYALLEAQLSHAQKMEVVGQCAAGASHDLRNILSVIHACAELALRREGADSQMMDLLRDIRRAAENAAHLAGRLMGLARPASATAFRPLTVSELLNQVAGLLRHVLPRRIQLVVECAPGLPPIAGDETMLEQVLLNLALNARDAIVDEGRLSVRAALTERRPAGPATTDEGKTASPAWPAHPSEPTGPTPASAAQTRRFICLSVADTGCGLDATVKARLFEPFFTTKKPGQGTGLGLSVVATIVREHGGWIDVWSEPGQGTRFDIGLPVWEAPRPADPRSPA